MKSLYESIFDVDAVSKAGNSIAWSNAAKEYLDLKGFELDKKNFILHSPARTIVFKASSAFGVPTMRLEGNSSIAAHESIMELIKKGCSFDANLMLDAKDTMGLRLSDLSFVGENHILYIDVHKRVPAAVSRSIQNFLDDIKPFSTLHLLGSVNKVNTVINPKQLLFKNIIFGINLKKGQLMANHSGLNNIKGAKCENLWIKNICSALSFPAPLIVGEYSRNASIKAILDGCQKYIQNYDSGNERDLFLYTHVKDVIETFKNLIRNNPGTNIIVSYDFILNSDSSRMPYTLKLDGDDNLIYSPSDILNKYPELAWQKCDLPSYYM